MTEKRNVFLACPTYGPMEPETTAGVASASREHAITFRNRRVSLLAMNCNTLWCDALNRRGTPDAPDYFAMLHADIGPEPLWLDKLIREMHRVGADVLSSVVAIKDDTGDCSTAVMEEDGCRRISGEELATLPPTFDVSAFGGPPRVLLANTGLFVCDFTQPWVEKVWFEIIDTIERREDGQFEARNLPEDWNFSKQCVEHGAKVFVTQTIRLQHFGRKGWELPTKAPEAD